MKIAERRLQKIFRRVAVGRLRNELRDGKTALRGYFEEPFRVKSKEVMLSTIELRGKTPKLRAPKRDPVSADLENAIALHSYYSNLDETQASDPRLWAYLSHVEFRKYTLARSRACATPLLWRSTKQMSRLGTRSSARFWISVPPDFRLKRIWRKCSAQKDTPQK